MRSRPDCLWGAMLNLEGSRDDCVPRLGRYRSRFWNALNSQNHAAFAIICFIDNTGLQACATSKILQIPG